MFRVAVDAAPLLGQPTGVGAVTAGFINELSKTASIEMVAYALSGRGAAKLPSVVPPGVVVSNRAMPAALLMKVWQRWSHPRAEWWTGAVDVVHGTNFVVPPANVATLVTVHDLTAIRYPELCTPVTLQYPNMIRCALRRGAHIHVTSNAVKAEVIEHFAIDESRVHVVEPGPPHIGNAALPAGRPYLIALGTVEPRKDYPLLVRAFDDIAREHDIDLVIAGADGWGADALDNAIDEAEYGGRIKRLGYVDDERRAGLLRGATALVYPSIYEGFGLPPLEAMSASVPVVATASPAVEESTKGAALLTPLGDQQALSGAMTRVIADDELRSQLISAGTARVAEMSWRESTEKMVALYRNIAVSR